MISVRTRTMAILLFIIHVISPRWRHYVYSVWTEIERRQPGYSHRIRPVPIRSSLTYRTPLGELERI
ncbi:hypothetical protein C496_21754 [Natronorubrum tibetense GA33]|uniref:Uncharacterized protein n=1 Tax=Natronorubrum tibetense GA33 TaxID=1114856 RepID=L9VIU8_9EURY|nr:hypothetical protein C496_21754 [Natronorubrum tibetense GA33]